MTLHDSEMNVQDGSSSNIPTTASSSNQQYGQRVLKLKWEPLKVPGTEHDIPRVKNHTATLVKDKIYIFGGYDGKKNHNKLHVLDVETWEWTQPPVQGYAPEGRNGHTATLVDNKIFILGGWLGTGPYAAKDLHVLNLGDGTNMKWDGAEFTGTPPGPANMHTSDLMPNRQMFVFRGGDGMQYLNDLHCLDVDSMHWKSPVVTTGTAPPPRANHASTVDKDLLYIFGGWDGHKRLNDLHILNSNTMVWQRLDCKGGIPPQPRAGMTLSYVRGNFYLFGGSGHATKCFNDLHSYDPVSQSWRSPALTEYFHPY